MDFGGCVPINAISATSAVNTLMNSTIFWLELTPVPSFKFRSASYPISAHISFSSSSAKAASVLRKLMIATAVFFIGKS